MELLLICFKPKKKLKRLRNQNLIIYAQTRIKNKEKRGITEEDLMILLNRISSQWAVGRILLGRGQIL